MFASGSLRIATAGNAAVTPAKSDFTGRGMSRAGEASFGTQILRPEILPHALLVLLPVNRSRGKRGRDTSQERLHWERNEKGGRSFLGKQTTQILRPEMLPHALLVLLPVNRSRGECGRDTGQERIHWERNEKGGRSFLGKQTTQILRLEILPQALLVLLPVNSSLLIRSAPAPPRPCARQSGRGLGTDPPPRTRTGRSRHGCPACACGGRCPPRIMRATPARPCPR